MSATQVVFWDATVDVPLSVALFGITAAQSAGVQMALGPQANQIVTIAPGYEGPLYSPNPWDQIKIDGTQLPGICDIEKADPRRRIDKKKQAGADGGNPTTHGYDPTPIQISCRIWTPMQLALLEQILGNIWPSVRKGGKPPAYQIDHPQLQLAHITAGIFIGITSLRPGRVRGERMMSFLLEEFNPVKGTKSAVSSPVAARPVVQPYSDKNAPPVPVAGARYTADNAQPDAPGSTGTSSILQP